MEISLKLHRVELVKSLIARFSSFLMKFLMMTIRLYGADS